MIFIQTFVDIRPLELKGSVMDISMLPDEQHGTESTSIDTIIITPETDSGIEDWQELDNILMEVDFV
jgi:hypothetical protein